MQKHRFEPRISVTSSGLFAFAILTTFLFSYANVIYRLAEIWWENADYSHGFLVPVVSAVYMFIHRDVLLDGFNRERSWTVVAMGVAFICAGFLLRLAGIMVRALPVEGYSIVALVAGLILLLCGWRALWVMVPACLFLILMIPLPSGLVTPLRSNLQSVATSVSVFTLQTIGLPAIARGNVILLPEAEIGVAEACSGLRMLVAFTALVAALTMFVERPRLDKVILMLCIIPIAVIVNAWRVVVVAVATYYRPEWADTVHDYAGLGMMFLAIGLLWLILQFLSKLFQPASTENSKHTQATVKWNPKTQQS